MEGIEIRDIDGKGIGIYATQNYGVGDKVLAFKGNPTSERGMHTLQVGLLEHILVEEPERYVNHSCDPNCGINERVVLVAMKQIKKGEEITIDYGMAEPDLVCPFDCCCGSENCRGWINGFQNLPDTLKKKYKGFISDYLIATE